MINKLLKKGYKYIIKLLGFLFAKKRTAIFEVLRRGTNDNNLRELSRELPW